jgi:hypothetical protein
MRQRNFAGLRVAAAAYQSYIADGLVRRPERPRGNQRIRGGQFTGYRMYLGSL